METSLSLKNFRPVPRFSLGPDFADVSPSGDRISFNNYFMEKNGSPFPGISGEFHYSRMDPCRWEDEIIKMRMGGINIVSTYLFWNHIEEEEGTFDFTGRRDLRLFVNLCAKHGLYVILRIGPFDHGEVRNGGLPDWLFGKPFEVRTTDPAFLSCVRRLYQAIGEQVQGLFFREGGPIIGVQLDNEYMHSSAPWEMTTGISNEWVFGGDEGESYILALRDLALSCGMAPAFFTGTAWGGAAYSPRVLPLWGGYAYRPWIFYSHRGEHPATEEYLYEDYHHNGKACADDFTPPYAPEDRPYACCEMGGGMMTCYYYRFIYPYRSVDALANIKLGSGCNFVGYYMFQGGTNPIGKNGTYLNESQVPKLSYDYQAALGEFGQLRESYRRLKSVHFFLSSFGDRLAPMDTVLPEGASALDPCNTDQLRFAVRTDGASGFLFVNNFQDHFPLPPRTLDRVLIETAEDTFAFEISLARDENAILPFRFDMDGILLRTAEAQPLLRTTVHEKPTYVFMVPEGLSGRFCFEEGAEITGDTRSFFTVRRGALEADVVVLSRQQADQLFVLRDGSLLLSDQAPLEDEQGGLRLETVARESRLCCYPPDRLAAVHANRLPDQGIWGVYSVSVPGKDVPVLCRQTAQTRWTLTLPEDALEGVKDVRLRVDYQGDIGFLFLNDVLINDHFCNGDIWEIGLREHADQLKEGRFVLKITPLKQDAHVNVESAMAARNEEVGSLLAELRGVSAQPVYEIRL